MDIQARDERVPVAASLRIPVVLIGVPDDPAGLHCVDLDFAAAARLAVDELADTGHDRVVVHGLPGGDGGARPQLRPPLPAMRRRRRPTATACRTTLIAPVEPGRAAAAGRRRPRARRARRRPARDRRRRTRRSCSACCTRCACAASSPGRDVSVIGARAPTRRPRQSEPPVTNVSPEPRDVSRRAMETLFWLLDPTPAGAPPRDRPRRAAAHPAQRPSMPAPGESGPVRRAVDRGPRHRRTTPSSIRIDDDARHEGPGRAAHRPGIEAAADAARERTSHDPRSARSTAAAGRAASDARPALAVAACGGSGGGGGSSAEHGHEPARARLLQQRAGQDASTRRCSTPAASANGVTIQREAVPGRHPDPEGAAAELVARRCPTC